MREREFVPVESLVVVGLRPPDGVVVGVEGLDDDLARHVATPAPACHLGEELEGPFRGPEVRDVQGGIGGNDADERDAGEVVPLGNHLGAHEHVDVSPVEGVENLRMGPPARRRVAVHPGDPRRGEKLFYFFFQPLRAHTVAFHAAAPAVRAERRAP